MVAVRSLGAGGGLVHRVEGGDAVGAVPGAAGDLEPTRAEVRSAVDADRVPAVARAAADEGTGREGDQRERIVVRGESTDRLGCAGPGKNAHEAKRVLASVQGRAALGRTAVADLPLLLELRVARQPVEPTDAFPGPVVAAEDVGEGVAGAGADPQASEPGDGLLAVAGAAGAGEGSLDAGIVQVGAEESLDVTPRDGGIRPGGADAEHLAVGGGERGQPLEEGWRVAAGEALPGGRAPRSGR